MTSRRFRTVRRICAAIVLLAILAASFWLEASQRPGLPPALRIETER